MDLAVPRLFVLISVPSWVDEIKLNQEGGARDGLIRRKARHIAVARSIPTIRASHNANHANIAPPTAASLSSDDTRKFDPTTLFVLSREPAVVPARTSRVSRENKKLIRPIRKPHANGELSFLSIFAPEQSRSLLYS